MKVGKSNLDKEFIISLGWEETKWPDVFNMKRFTPGCGDPGTFVDKSFIPEWTLSVNWRSSIHTSYNGEPASFCGYIPDNISLYHITRSLGLLSKDIERDLKIDSVLCR
jgi:hypothetical protein